MKIATGQSRRRETDGRERYNSRMGFSPCRLCAAGSRGYHDSANQQAKQAEKRGLEKTDKQKIESLTPLVLSIQD